MTSNTKHQHELNNHTAQPASHASEADTSAQLSGQAHSNISMKPSEQAQQMARPSSATQQSPQTQLASKPQIQPISQSKSNHPKTQVKVAMKVSRSTNYSELDREADKKSMGQVRKTAIFLAFVAIVYIAYLVISGQFDEFVTSLAGVDLGWITAGIICFMFYYVFGVLAYVFSIMGDPHCPVGFRDLMSVEASGVFFMRLTPSGVAAPPAQIYRLTRAGLSPGAAGALQFTRFVIYEAGEGVFAAIMLLFCGGYFYETFGDVTLIGLFLFGFKVVQVAIFLALCLLPRPVMALSNWLLRFVNRHGWLKDEKYQKYHSFINTQVMEFSTAFKVAAKNVKELFATLIVTLLQLGCMYALPYFVLRAFGEPADLLICLASGSMLELLVNAVPLPGGTGGAEVGFAYLFGKMFGPHLSAGFVIWRAVEYLLPVVVAMPCMGMRSNSQRSIHDRWQYLYQRVQFFIETGQTRGKKTNKAHDGVTIRPNTKPQRRSQASGHPARKPDQQDS